MLRGATCEKHCGGMKLWVYENPCTIMILELLICKTTWYPVTHCGRLLLVVGQAVTGTPARNLWPPPHLLVPLPIELALRKAPGGTWVRHLKVMKGSKFEVMLFSWHLVFEQMCFVQQYLLIQGTALDFLNVAHMNGNQGVRGQILLLALRPKKRSGIRQRDLK